MFLALLFLKADKLGVPVGSSGAWYSRDERRVEQ
jgi:hypothetical protein